MNFTPTPLTKVEKITATVCTLILCAPFIIHFRNDSEYFTGLVDGILWVFVLHTAYQLGRGVKVHRAIIAVDTVIGTILTMDLINALG